MNEKKELPSNWLTKVDKVILRYLGKPNNPLNGLSYREIYWKYCVKAKTN